MEEINQTFHVLGALLRSLKNLQLINQALLLQAFPCPFFFFLIYGQERLAKIFHLFWRNSRGSLLHTLNDRTLLSGFGLSQSNERAPLILNQLFSFCSAETVTFQRLSEDRTSCVTLFTPVLRLAGQPFATLGRFLPPDRKWSGPWPNGWMCQLRGPI